MRSIAILLLCLAASSPRQPAPSATTLLDLYASGEFDAVVSILGDRKNFDELLADLQHNAPAWLDAGGPQDRARRELTAATVALEAARAGEWQDWKLLQRLPALGSYQPPDSLTWRAPPRLIAWGNDLFKRDPAPRPIERWWQLAAVAVAERSEDFEFLLGTPVRRARQPARRVRVPQRALQALPHRVSLRARSRHRARIADLAQSQAHRQPRSAARLRAAAE